MFNIEPTSPATTSTYAPSLGQKGGNTASSRQSRLPVQAEHGAPGVDTRIQTRNVAAMFDNPLRTPEHQQSNVDDDVEAGNLPNEVMAGNEIHDSDSESQSVIAVPAAEHTQPPATPAAAGLRRGASRALMGSIPAIAGIALMIEGSKEDNDAMLWSGLVLTASTGAYLTRLAIDNLVDCVMACCGDGSAAQ